MCRRFEAFIRLHEGKNAIILKSVGVGAAVKRVASYKTRAETVTVDDKIFAIALESSTVKVMYLSNVEKSRQT